MRAIYSTTSLLLLAFIAISINAQLPNQNVKMDINDQSLFDIYQSNVYIVDLVKHKNKPLSISCFTRVDVVDLNLTFSGLDFKSVRVGIKKLGLYKKYH